MKFDYGVQNVCNATMIIFQHQLTIRSCCVHQGEGDYVPSRETNTVCDRDAH